MLEIIGVITTVIAVGGVILNNRKVRWCFCLWMVSNFLSMTIHVLAAVRGNNEMWAFAVRDGIFLILAVEGWNKWR